MRRHGRRQVRNSLLQCRVCGVMVAHGLWGSRRRSNRTYSINKERKTKMQEIIKEVPKGFYERIPCVVVPVGDNVKLLEEHHKNLIEYWISINGYKLMIPIWFYENIFHLYEANAFLCTKYFYLDEDYKEYYVYEDKEKILLVKPF